MSSVRSLAPTSRGRVAHRAPVRGVFRVGHGRRMHLPLVTIRRSVASASATTRTCVAFLVVADLVVVRVTIAATMVASALPMPSCPSLFWDGPPTLVDRHGPSIHPPDRSEDRPDQRSSRTAGRGPPSASLPSVDRRFLRSAKRSLPAGGFEGGDWWMRFERVLPSRWRRKRHVQAKSAAVRRR